MTKAAVRCGAFAALLVLATACSNSLAPTAPSAPTTTTAGTVAPARPLLPPAIDFPPVTRPARIYLFASPLSYPVREWTNTSRFVLYDDGAFALQYQRSLGSFEYRGTYTEANGTIAFAWEGWSVAGPWEATGTLSGDTLTVRYDLIMELTDFENAVYTRVRDLPASATAALWPHHLPCS